MTISLVDDSNYYYSRHKHKTYSTDEYKQVVDEADTKKSSNVGYPESSKPDGKLSKGELKDYQAKLTKQRDGLNQIKDIINKLFGKDSVLTKAFNDYINKETASINKKLDIAKIMSDHYDRFAEKGVPYPTFAAQDLQINKGTIDEVAKFDGNGKDVTDTDIQGKRDPDPVPKPWPCPGGRFEFSTQDVKDVLKKIAPDKSYVTDDQLKEFIDKADPYSKDAKIAKALLNNFDRIGNYLSLNEPFMGSKKVISADDIDRIAKEDGNSGMFSKLDILIKQLKERYNNWWTKPLPPGTKPLPPGTEPLPPETKPLPPGTEPLPPETKPLPLE